MVKTKQNTSNIKISVSPSGKRAAPQQQVMKKKRKPRTRSNKSHDSITSVAVAYSKPSRQGAAKTKVIENGIQVMDSEFISLLTVPANQVDSLYLLKRLRVNPLSVGTFTKLPSIARNYEYYKFLKLHFRYETRCGSNQAGSIIMSPDYDAADGQVATQERVIYGNKGTVDDAVWKESIIKLDPKSMNRLFKSHANMSDARFASTDQDQKTIDSAQVFICADLAGNTSAVTIGKLFVDYIVELTEPQAPTDPADQGGALLGFTTQNNTTTPILNGAALNAISNFPEEVVTPISNLDKATFPNATILKFARDYKGVLDLANYGAGITGSVPQVAVGPAENLNLAFGAAGDTALTGSAYMLPLTSSTLGRSTYRIEALAGQLLRLGTTGTSGINTMNFLLGGNGGVF